MTINSYVHTKLYLRIYNYNHYKTKAGVKYYEIDQKIRKIGQRTNSTVII